MDLRDKLLDAAVRHVPLDGWSSAAFKAACEDVGQDARTARAVCPRGALDLAVAYHRRGDEAMKSAVAAADLDGMKTHDRVAFAIRARLGNEDREVVRRSAATFALPLNAPHGAKLAWGTADAIWTALGDSSDDANWYSKRAILSGVYASVVLYWLGDESEGSEATWEFLGRRIADVMRFETLKDRLRSNPITRTPMAGLDAVASRIRPPRQRDDLPGRLAH